MNHYSFSFRDKSTIFSIDIAFSDRPILVNMLLVTGHVCYSFSY